MPLDIDPNADVNALSGLELQRSFVRALRLDRNWRKTPSMLKGISRVPHGDIVFQMQFIGSEWLVTLSRDPRTVHLSVWNVHIPKEARRIAFLDVPTASRFSTDLHPGNRELVIATISHTGGTLVRTEYALLHRKQKIYLTE